MAYSRFIKMGKQTEGRQNGLYTAAYDFYVWDRSKTARGVLNAVT